MEISKKMIIAIVAIVVIVIAIGAVFVSGFFDTTIEEMTPFDNDFSSGEFVGNVTVQNSTDKWSVAYADKENQIEYNMSTCKNASLLVDMYVIEGMEGPEHRTFNNIKWDIYHAQGTQNTENSTGDNKIDIFMCVANNGDQSYILYIIFYNTTKVDGSSGMYSHAYKDYIEPMLDTVTLKVNPDAPTIYDALGIDQATYQQYVSIVDQVKKGNQTAIQQYFGTE